MEFQEDFIKEQNLSEEQVKAVSELVTAHVSELETKWSGKANENAEGILNGVAKSVESLTGIKRDRGQKYADYLKSATDGFFESTKSELETKKTELENKLKNANTDEGLKAELETTKNQLIELKKKEATFADWEENDYKGKLETTQKELNGLRLEVAFNGVKPKFADNVNEFESRYKWNDFKKRINEKYEIQIIDDEAIAVDKNNEFTKVKLSELAAKDEILTSLSKGVAKRGLGTQGKTIKYKDVPFELPENATPQERSKMIKDYLLGKGYAITSNEYAKKYAELNQAILSQKTA